MGIRPIKNLTSTNITVINDATIGNDLSVLGDTQLNNLTVDGDTQLNNLTVNGDTRLNNLTVDGDTQLNNLTVNGDTQLNNLTVNGDTQLNNLTVSGSLDIPDGSIMTSDIADGAVTTSKFASNATAPNADLLDGFNSTQFLRSDTSDTLNGDLTVIGDLDVTGLGGGTINAQNIEASSNVSAFLRVAVDRAPIAPSGASFASSVVFFSTPVINQSGLLLTATNNARFLLYIDVVGTLPRLVIQPL